MADVVLNLIEPLESRYRWKDKTEAEITIAKQDMVAAFKSYAIEDLRAAVMHITLHRKFSTMPNAADVRDVLEHIVAERKIAEQKPSKNPGVSTGANAFMDGLQREKDIAQQWAREWLQKTPLGQESLRDGWCRELWNIVWQIKRNRTRAGRDVKFEDIQLDDIATQTLRGDKLIAYFKENCCARNPRFERALVLKLSKDEIIKAQREAA